VSGQGITIANFNVSINRGSISYEILGVTGESGVYQLRIWLDAPPIPVGIGEAYADLAITLQLDNYETKELELSVTIQPTEAQLTMSNAISLATPSLFLILFLAVLWTRHFSIPKRLRQLNGQINALRKGKMPKPITESKSRQELIAELFNDTFVKLEISRIATDMPEASIPIEVPEIRELLIQLSILTHLNQEELDEFNADISKMKMSEQAAFVKEVIVQEAIRAARAQGKTVEEVIEEVEHQAARMLADPDELEVLDVEPVEEAEERVFLIDEEVEEEVKEVVSEDEAPTEEEAVKTEKLSTFELEELKSELLKRGVPNHEIDMIMDQARNLSRELVDELIESLGLKD
jgi:hypothetical protein